MSTLADLLMNNRATILKRWFDMTTDTYPVDTAGFLKHEGDPFLNPIGATIDEAIKEIYAAITGEMSQERITSALDDVIKIKAVQAFSPSQAIGFVFLLKRAAREALTEQLREPRLLAEMAEFDSRVDAVALTAFDLFVKHRERIYEIRASEMKNRTAILLERANRLYGSTE